MALRQEKPIQRSRLPNELEWEFQGKPYRMEKVFLTQLSSFELTKLYYKKLSLPSGCKERVTKEIYFKCN